MTENRTALVLGATGGIGSEVARRLKRRGWAIRALHRDVVGQVRRHGNQGYAWVHGDAMRAADVVEAAKGVSLIVHAVNPPGYRNWGRRVLPMLDATIAAAKASGARILLPGTVYNYGPEAFPEIDEAAPQNPKTRKGRIRAEMERRLRAVSQEGVRVLIVRAGDFFGPEARNNWFSQGLVKPERPVAAITSPGRPGVGHQWAYLPDVAETMVALVEREAELGAFETFHMNGHRDEDGTAMIGAIRKAVGRPDLPVRPLPWRLMALASPFVPLFRELSEMRYLWRQEVALRNDRLIDFLGAEPHTPLDAAVRATLSGLGCLAADAPVASSAVPMLEGR